MATCAKLAAQTSSRQRGRRGKLTVKPRVGLRVVVSILGHPTPAHTNTTHARARKRMCVRLTCSLRSCATVKVLCHDDKGVGKAALVRSQSLASRPHIHTFFAGLLSVHTLAKPSLEFEKPGTHGDSGRDSGDSGELSQGLMGTQENSARDSWGLRELRPLILGNSAGNSGGASPRTPPH